MLRRLRTGLLYLLLAVTMVLIGFSIGGGVAFNATV
jgi:hypothetical protein